MLDILDYVDIVSLIVFVFFWMGGGIKINMEKSCVK